MLSSRLIRMIEDHLDQITDRVVRQITRDSKTYEFGKLPESEIRSRSHDLLANLGARLPASRDDFAKSQEDFGKRRFEEGIPLHEVVHALHVIKDKTIEFIRDEGFPQTSLEIYAEEELEYNLGRLFDGLVYSVVRGYERAMRDAVLKVASATSPPAGRA